MVAKSKPRPTVLRGGSGAEGSVTVYSQFPKIHFHKATILAQPDGAAAQQVYKARFVLLDTLHEPEAHPFEYEFLALLGRRNFRGLLMLDDIHLNAEMRRLWDALYWGKVPGLPLHKYALYDATAVGHFSGSGLVDPAVARQVAAAVRAVRVPLRPREAALRRLINSSSVAHLDAPQPVREVRGVVDADGAVDGGGEEREEGEARREAREDGGAEQLERREAEEVAASCQRSSAPPPPRERARAERRARRTGRGGGARATAYSAAPKRSRRTA